MKQGMLSVPTIAAYEWVLGRILCFSFKRFFSNNTNILITRKTFSSLVFKTFLLYIVPLPYLTLHLTLSVWERRSIKSPTWLATTSIMKKAQNLLIGLWHWPARHRSAKSSNPALSKISSIIFGSDDFCSDKKSHMDSESSTRSRFRRRRIYIRNKSFFKC